MKIKFITDLPSCYVSSNPLSDRVTVDGREYKRAREMIKDYDVFKRLRLTASALWRVLSAFDFSEKTQDDLRAAWNGRRIVAIYDEAESIGPLSPQETPSSGKGARSKYTAEEIELFLQEAAAGDCATIQSKIEAGFPINLGNARGETALLQAAANGKEELLSYLIAHNASIDQATIKGITPLFVALNRRRDAIVDLLLKKGATINFSDKFEVSHYLGYLIKNRLKDPTEQLLSALGDDLYSQKILVPKLSHFARLRGKEDCKSDGLCRGLSLLNVYYQFLGQEDAFYHRIQFAVQAVVRDDLSTKSYGELSAAEKEMEHLFNDLYFPQTGLHVSEGMTSSQMPASDLFSWLTDQSKLRALKSTFFVSSFFPFSQDRRCPLLEEILWNILSKEQEKEKALLIYFKKHVVNLFAKDGNCFFYECENCQKLPPFPLERSSLTSIIAMMFTHFDIENLDLCIAIDVLMVQDFDDISDLQRITNEKTILRSDNPALLEYAAAFAPPQFLSDLIHRSSLQGDQLSSLLSIAIGNQHITNVVELLAHDGLDCNHQNETGETNLFVAAGYGYEPIVELLLAEESIDVNLAQEDGATPLFVAVCKDHHSIIKLLLAHKHIDVNRSRNDGSTPLLAAAANGRHAIVELLLKKDNVDVNRRRNDGVTPLFAAAWNGHHAIVELLLTKDNVDVNLAEEQYGATPLFVAACTGRISIVELLLTNNADPKIRSKGGESPLDAAHDNHHKEIELLLLQHQEPIPLKF